ncbi:RNA-dependent RNA polymerase [Sanxia atyid shrimp virus 4]|uniref:RNA-directed RNA polymerase L n=1 Tax=Sanxia atyid shrimp virus 4 TaxID=1923358 RepID=A0A1L3KMY9_9VIRU|nr:RNA-dependent RNA polymerase [Sanxia atyid shrimp virus 4]APG78770.1 RNA-dependent RNA polymerase [Sanxia atyid shrimp virus 4]
MPSVFSKVNNDASLRNPEHLITMRKLDLALKDGPALKLKHDIRNNINTVSRRVLETHTTSQDLLDASTSVNIWPLLLLKIITDSNYGTYYNKHNQDTSSRSLNIARQLLTIQTNWMNQHNFDITAPEFKETFKTWCDKSFMSDPLLANLLFLEDLFSSAVEMSGQVSFLLRKKKNRLTPRLISNKTFMIIKQLDLFICWSNGLVFLRHNKQGYIHQRQFLLLIHNKLCDLLSVYLLSKFTENVCFDVTAQKQVIDLIEEMCNLSIRYGNDYFDIIRTLEGITTGEILMSEEDWRNDSLIQSIHQDLLDVNFCYIGSRLQQILTYASTPLKHELSGLSKITGHPIVDEEGTAERAYERANKVKSLNYLAINSSRNLAVESYIRSYILKHRKWPPCIIQPEAGKWLHSAKERNLDPYHPNIQKQYGSGTFEEFTYVDLEPVKELDQLLHYTQYLKDKTVTLEKSKIFRHYINVYDKPRWEETRLLLVYLFHTNEDLGLSKYLQDYLNTAPDMNLALDYLVIKLVPKEKELKRKARLFGCKTYQDRYRGKVQEEAVMSFMSDYVQDQSMTLDDIGLMHRLYSFRHLLKAYKGWKVLYVNFDVSGWCSNFRHETVHPIAHDILDKYYQTGDFFGKTQLAYEHGLFYIPKQDGSGAYHWEGQLGGVEGLNQDTWMMVYIPQMRLALHEFQAHMFVMAYGDDYKAALLIPPDQANRDITTLKNKIIEVVSNVAQTCFAQDMKVFDSYGSECFISFCKNASVRGVELSQGFRKIQKCYGANNAFLPHIDDYIASAFSNSHSASRHMPVSYAPFLVGAFWSIHHLLHHYLYEHLSDEQILALLMVPSCVGGFPVIYLYHYFVRGESDHLSTFLDLWKFTTSHYKTVSQYIQYGLRYNLMNPINLEALLRDPYSLPLSKPPLPSTVFRKFIMPSLESKIQNEDMLELLNLANDQFSKYAIRRMVSSDLLQPRILSSLYACLPASLVEEFTRRFENSSTIKDLLVLKYGFFDSQSKLRKVVVADRKLQKWRLGRLLGNTGEVDHSIKVLQSTDWCPARAADILRADWGKPMIGITMPPPTHLLKFVTPEDGVASQYDIRNHFTYEVHGIVSDNVHDLPSQHWSLGPHKPFLGHRTRLGTEVPQVRFIERNPLLSNLSKLLDTLSWVNKSIVLDDGTVIESNLYTLIHEIIRQYYTQDPEFLKPFSSQRKSGSITHHWRCPHFSEFIMPNQLYNVNTWVIGDSNTHAKYRATVEKFHVNFLYLMIYTYNILMQMKEISSVFIIPRKVWAVTRECTYCDTAIREDPIIISDEEWVLEGRHLEGVSLDKLSQQVIEKSLHEWNSRGTFKNPIQLDLEVEDAAYGVCQKFIDQVHSTHERLAARYNAPMLTSEGMNILSAWGNAEGQVLIRETEIRHIPPPIMASCILTFAYNWALKKYGFKTVLLTDIAVSTINPRDLPWYPLLELIHASGMLGELIHEIKDMTNRVPGMVYDNPLTASKYILNASMEYINSGQGTSTTILLSYYEDDQLREKYMNVCENFRWRIFFKSILHLYKESVTNQDITSLETLTYATIILFSSPTADFEEAVGSDIREYGGVETLELLTYDIPDDDDYLLMLEDEESLLYLALEILDTYHDTSKDLRSYLDEGYSNGMDFLLSEVLQTNTHKFIRATLADCITVIRSQDLPPLMQYQILTPNQSESREIGMTGVETRTHWISQRLKTVDMPKIDTYHLQGLLLIYPSEEIIVSEHYLHRPYSRGTSTINKHLALESAIGLDPSTLSNKFFAFLGEGYGGALDSMAARCKNSHFLYNSLPPAGETPNFPHIAQESLHANGHTYDVTLCNSGIYDLCETSTVVALCNNDNHLYHFVSCDAEIPWENEDKYYRLLLNACMFYLDKRSSHGIFFCKMFLEAIDSINKVLSLLVEFCKSVKIVRLNSSPPGGEIYVVCRGRRKPYRISSHPDIIVSPQIARQVFKITQIVRNKYQKMIPNKEIVISFTPPSHIFYLKQFVKIFNPYFIQTLHGTKSISIILDYWVYPNVSLTAKIERLLSDLDHLSRQLHKRIETLHSQRSAAELNMLIRRYLFIRSIIVHANLLKNDVTEIRQSQVRTTYVTNLASLPDRCRIHDLEHTLYLKDVTWLGLKGNPYQDWIDGLNVIFSLKTFLELLM